MKAPRHARLADHSGDLRACMDQVVSEGSGGCTAWLTSLSGDLRACMDQVVSGGLAGAAWQTSAVICMYGSRMEPRMSAAGFHGGNGVF